MSTASHLSVQLAIISTKLAGPPEDPPMFTFIMIVLSLIAAYLVIIKPAVFSCIRNGIGLSIITLGDFNDFLTPPPPCKIFFIRTHIFFYGAKDFLKPINPYVIKEVKSF